MDEQWTSEEMAAERAQHDAPAVPPTEEAEDFLGRDLEEFSRRFPGVDPLELEDDGMFRRFCGSRYGKEPLAELYADYLAITRTVWEAARLSADDTRSRATGTGGAGGGDAHLTSAQQRELEEWNQANPHMKMSAKEFLSR